MQPSAKPTPVRLALAGVSFSVVIAVGLLARERLRSAFADGPLASDEAQQTVRIVERGDSLNARLTARSRRGPVPAMPGRVMEPLTLDEAKLLVPSLNFPSPTRYDPVTLFENQPNARFRREFGEHPSGFFRRATNDRGFREDDDVLVSKPDLRILVTGDSHAEGVVPNAESFTNVLEARLSTVRGDRVVEALNAGCGGYSFFNYLGVLTKHLDLDPDVFVMAVYGGNDFAGAVYFHRWFRRLPPSVGDKAFNEAQSEASRRYTRAYAQSLNQVLRFRRFPEEEELAFDAARDVTREVARLCAENEIRFVVAYIPSPAEVSLEAARPEFEKVCALFGESSDVRTDARAIGERYLGFLADEGIAFADLRQVFEASAGPVYWQSDHHINTLGHRLVAEALLLLIE